MWYGLPQGHLMDYLLRIEWRDGTASTIDLAFLVTSSGGVFAALHDPSAFAAVRVDHAAGTMAPVRDIPIEVPQP